MKRLFWVALFLLTFVLVFKGILLGLFTSVATVVLLLGVNLAFWLIRRRQLQRQQWLLRSATNQHFPKIRLVRTPDDGIEVHLEDEN